ncbi:hypothetical protein GGI35DRAFT_489837 [Trichoderma velutinum]
MSKTIVIVGVTGAQGSSVARTFQSFPQWRVRGITRYPASSAAQALAANGVELVEADLDDKQSLVPAFEGATVIFSNTDFFALLANAMASGDLPLGRNPSKVAFYGEVAQGINIAEAAASPAVLKTLERFVYSSLSDARKWSGGKYTTAYHFNSKAETVKVIQNRFPELAARMSTIQIGHYVENWKSVPGMAPLKQPDGTFLVIRPMAPSYQLPFVVVRRDTGSFVKALVDMPPGKDLLGVSQTMSWQEWTELWGRILGIKASFKEVSSQEFFRNLPSYLGQELEDSYNYIKEFGYTGGDPNVLKPDMLNMDISLISIEEYISGEDWSSILNS